VTGSERGQSNVVGVAVLLGVTVVALGLLTASVGTVVDQHAAASDAQRVAADLDDALRPVETTGVRRGTVSFTSGRLETLDREVRVLDSGGNASVVNANALRFVADDRGATYLAGAVLAHGSGWSRTRSPVTVTADPDVLVVGVPALRGDIQRTASGGVTYTLRSNVTHDRRNLGRGGYRVAVETAHPDAVRAQFERWNATVTERDIDGDGTPSVVADFPGARTAYVVVHETEVSMT